MKAETKLVEKRMFEFSFEAETYSFAIPVLGGKLPVSGPIINLETGKTHYFHRDFGLHGLYLCTKTYRHYYLDLERFEVSDQTGNGLPDEKLPLAYDPAYLRPAGKTNNFSLDLFKNNEFMYPGGVTEKIMNRGSSVTTQIFYPQRYIPTKEGLIQHIMLDIPENFFSQTCLSR